MIKPRMSDAIHHPALISELEIRNNAKFVLECERAGLPAMLFYQENPPKPEYSNYFLVGLINHRYFISDGKWAADRTYSGFVVNEEFVHSRYVHDYRKVHEGLWIDGGQDYLRVVGDINKPVTNVTIVAGNLCVVN